MPVLSGISPFWRRITSAARRSRFRRNQHKGFGVFAGFLAAP